jgi:hypothetical protein
LSLEDLVALLSPDKVQLLRLGEFGRRVVQDWFAIGFEKTWEIDDCEDHMSGSGDDPSELRDIVCQFPGGVSKRLFLI